MIFVILGTQKFQFNRLLKMLDTLVEKKVISEPICAQIGYSTYQPKYYEYHQFFSEEDFQKKIAESDYIIAHGGLGSMMSSMRAGKKIIVVPRSAHYGEHVDDHQYQLATLFQSRGHLLMAESERELVEAYCKIREFRPVPYRTAKNCIEKFIGSCIEGEEFKSNYEKVLMVGSDLSVKGGIVSVIRNYLYCNFWQSSDVLFVSTHVEGGKVKKLLHFLRALAKIRKVIARQKLKLVHIHVSERGSFLRKAMILKIAKKRNCKVILHHHGAEFEEFYQESSPKMQKFISDILEQADMNIVLSKRLVPMIENINPKAKIKVLYNAVRTSENNYYNPEAREMMMLGRLEQRKGTFELLEVIKEIDAQLPKDIVFNLCGDGDLDKVHEAIKRLDISHRIKYVGWIHAKQKEELFHNIMCNILFSRNEGLPMAILETMSNGIPNISTNVASIPEVVINDETGILLEAGDKEGLGKAILKMVEDQEYRLRLSKNAHRLIYSNFSLANNVQILESYYKLLLEEN